MQKQYVFAEAQESSNLKDLQVQGNEQLNQVSSQIEDNFGRAQDQFPIIVNQNQLLKAQHQNQSQTDFTVANDMKQKIDQNISQQPELFQNNVDKKQKFDEVNQILDRLEKASANIANQNGAPNYFLLRKDLQYYQNQQITNLIQNQDMKFEEVERRLNKLETSIKQYSIQNCKKGHLLQQTYTSLFEVFKSCEVCKTKLKVGSTHYICEKCSYYKCLKCMQHQTQIQ